MGEKGLKASLIQAHDELPEGYHIEVVQDAKGIPRPIGTPDGGGIDPETHKPYPDKPRLIWDEKLGIWIPV